MSSTMHGGNKVPKNCLPFQIIFTNGKPTLIWVQRGKIDLTSPFYDEAIEKKMEKRVGALGYQTPLDYLIHEVFDDPNRKPSGFIFHVSRCGSTTVAQVLSQIDGNLMLSEPEVVNRILAAPQRFGAKRKAAWFRGLLNSYWKNKVFHNKKLFIKMASWGMVDFDFLHKIYPTVPWVVIFRHPVEVMMSNLSSMPTWLVKQDVTSVLYRKHFGTHLPKGLHPIESLAKNLERHYTLPLNFPQENGLFIDYARLKEGMSEILEHFNVPLNSKSFKVIESSDRIHSKTLSPNFRDDSLEKRMTAPDEVKTWAEKLIMEPYKELLKRSQENCKIRKTG